MTNEPYDYDPHDTEIKALYGQPPGNAGELPQYRPRRSSTIRCDLRAEMVNIENAVRLVRQLLHELEQLERDE